MEAIEPLQRVQTLLGGQGRSAHGMQQLASFFLGSQWEFSVHAQVSWLELLAAYVCGGWDLDALGVRWDPAKPPTVRALLLAF
eukprot:11931527-Alexandrium_andersonii.AAC.1